MEYFVAFRKSEDTGPWANISEALHRAARGEKMPIVVCEFLNRESMIAFCDKAHAEESEILCVWAEAK